MLIRSFREDDRQSVLVLAARLQEGVAPWRDQTSVLPAVTGWVEESIDQAHEEDRAVFVAEDGGHLVGFVTVSTRHHFTEEIDAYVGELVTAPAAVRSGVGTALMSTAEEGARARGLRRLTLETGAANTTGRRFYDTLGYELEEVCLSKGL